MKCKEYIFSVDEEYENVRIDVVISENLEEASRSSIQRLIDGGQVTINNEICLLKKQKVKQGDEIIIKIPEPKELNVIPENLPIDIIYEDSDLIIVNKGKNMVVHPAAGNESGTLVNAILYHCNDLSTINGVIRPGIVHRIDKDTTGLLMIAKNDKAHVSLANQLAEHSINRAYHAVVYNNFIEDEGTINLPLGRDPKNRLKRAVTSVNSKEAVTHYKVLERFGKFTYLELKLETGRTHQIRVHMAYKNHPILGDSLYGPKKVVMGIKSQMLHAKMLGFIHPTTDEYIEFQSSLPEEFENLLNKLRSQD